MTRNGPDPVDRGPPHIHLLSPAWSLRLPGGLTGSTVRCQPGTGAGVSHERDPTHRAGRSCAFRVIIVYGLEISSCRSLADSLPRLVTASVSRARRARDITAAVTVYGHAMTGRAAAAAAGSGDSQSDSEPHAWSVNLKLECSRCNSELQF